MNWVGYELIRNDMNIKIDIPTFVSFLNMYELPDLYLFPIFIQISNFSLQLEIYFVSNCSFMGGGGDTRGNICRI
jgi:hypothetical protein